MKIGFGAPVSGAWATPDNIAAFATRAEAGRLRLAVDVPAADRPRGLRHGSGLSERARPDGRAGLRRRRHQPDQARRRGRQPAVRLPRLPGQTGGQPGCPVGRAARPGPRPRLDAGGVRRERRVHGAPGRPRRGVRRGAADDLWAQAACEFSGEFYSVPLGSVAPTPVQPGGPPILLGGMAPAGAASGSAGSPTAGSPRAGPTCPGSTRASAWSRSAALQAGRDPAGLRIICRGVVRAGARRRPPTATAACCCPAAATRSAADTRVAGRARGHRGVLRPELGSRRSARRTPTRRRRPPGPASSWTRWRPAAPRQARDGRPGRHAGRRHGGSAADRHAQHRADHGRGPDRRRPGSCRRRW